MAQNEFVDELMTTLAGKVSDEDLTTILWEISALVRHWEIHRRSTSLALYTGLPLPYKAYMVTKKLEGRSELTLEQYRLVLERMLVDINKELVEITTNDLRFYLLEIQKSGKVSDRTLDHKRGILNAFFDWCTKEGYIDRNPCASINKIKYEEKKREPISDLQLEMLRDACKDYREKALLEVLYSSGCRCDELAHLKIEDVDFQTREVKLFGKGRKHRVSYINAKAQFYLSKYLKERIDNEPWLFVSERFPFHALTNSGIEKIIHTIGERVEMTDVYPHRFRHTFATDALNRGMPVTELQKLMGHAGIETTMIYAKVNTATLGTSHSKVII